MWDLDNFVPKSLSKQDIADSGVGKLIASKAATKSFSITYMFRKIGWYVYVVLNSPFIVVHTGTCSGLTAVDIDVKGTTIPTVEIVKNAFKNEGIDLSKIAHSVTPSGGMHIYFKYDSGLAIKNQNDIYRLIDRHGVEHNVKIDIKGECGSVNEIGRKEKPDKTAAYYNFTVPICDKTIHPIFNTTALVDGAADKYEELHYPKPTDDAEFDRYILNQYELIEKPYNHPSNALIHFYMTRTFIEQSENNYYIRRANINEYLAYTTGLYYDKADVEKRKKMEVAVKRSPYNCAQRITEDTHFERFVVDFLKTIPYSIVQTRKGPEWRLLAASIKYACHPDYYDRAAKEFEKHCEPYYVLGNGKAGEAYIMFMSSDVTDIQPSLHARMSKMLQRLKQMNDKNVDELTKILFEFKRHTKNHSECSRY